MDATVSAKRERIVIAAILLLAATLRIIAAIVIPDQSAALPDALSYRASAVQLLSQWRMTDPFQMPLYPLLIAAAGPGIGQLAADIALSVISVRLVCALTRELFADPYATILAGLAAACYPPLIFFAVVGLSETLYIMLILAAFLLWYRANFALAAIAAVLAVLTRPVFDIFAPLLVLVFALVVHRMPVLRAIGQLAIYAVVYCVLMSPWWLNNQRAYGSFVHLTVGGGTALYAGNNPMNHSGGGNIGVDYDVAAFNGITDPVARDRALRDAALAYIIDNPQRFLELAGLKFIRMWRLWPANEQYRNPATILVALGSFAPVLILACAGLFLKRRMMRRLSPILLFIAGYTGVHMIIVGTIRYRLPLEPFLLVFAGAGATYIVQAMRSALARRQEGVAA